MTNQSTILIIGGMGAIGKNLIEYLVTNTPVDIRNIYVMDNLSSSNMEDFGVNYIWCDIRDQSKLKSNIPTSTEYIFHLAAHFANQNSVEHPLIDINVNVIGTINILEVSKELRFLKKFVYASSSCIYGNNEFMSEDSVVYPTETPYAINKLAAEMYCEFYREYHNIPTISIRIFNTYGKYEKSGKYRNVIPNFIEKALLNDDIIITGDGSETRDFTYAFDTAQAMVLAAKSNKHGYFNAGTGIKTSISVIANTIIDITKSKSKITYANRRNWDNVKDRVSSIQKSNDELGYKPKYTDLIQNLKVVIQWYKEELQS